MGAGFVASGGRRVVVMVLLLALVGSLLAVPTTPGWADDGEGAESVVGYLEATRHASFDPSEWPELDVPEAMTLGTISIRHLGDGKLRMTYLHQIPNHPPSHAPEGVCPSGLSGFLTGFTTPTFTNGGASPVFVLHDWGTSVDGYVANGFSPEAGSFQAIPGGPPPFYDYAFDTGDTFWVDVSAPDGTDPEVLLREAMGDGTDPTVHFGGSPSYHWFDFQPFPPHAQNPTNCSARPAMGVPHTRYEVPTPDPGFTVVDGEAAGAFSFVPATTIGDHEWDFGDGNGSSVTSPAHVYELPGTFTVTHCVDVICDTREVEVAAPEVTAGVVFVVDDEEVSAVGIGDEFTLRLDVSASDGVGELRLGFDPDLDVWLAELAEIEVDEDALPELPVAGEGGVREYVLEPGEASSFTWAVTAVESGVVTVETVVTGFDAADTAIDAIEVAGELEIGGLDIEVTVHYPEPVEGAEVSGSPGFQKDNNGDGVVDDADHRIEVEVVATNHTDVTLFDVGPLGGTGHVVSFHNRIQGDGVVSLELIDDEELDETEAELRSVSFGDIEPAESVTRRYAYVATGLVNAETRATLEAVPDGGGVVRAVGLASVQLLSDLAVEFEMAMESRAYTSGQVVRLFGAVRNVLEDEVDEHGNVVEEAPSVAVLVIPLVEGNAANGHVLTPDMPGRTPLAETPIVLEPGEEQDLSAILVTMPHDEPTEASVRYLVRAWVADGDDLGVEIDQARILTVEGDGAAAEHAASLAAYHFEPDDVRECVTEVLDDIVTCNLWVGIRTMALGLWDLAQLVPTGVETAVDARQRIVRWGLDMSLRSAEAVIGDPAAQQALATELEVQIATFRELGILAGDTTVSAFDAVGQALTEAEQTIATGDTEAILAFFSRQAGENIDLTIGGLAKVRVLAAMQRSTAEAAAQGAMTRAVVESRERAARRAQTELEQRVRRAIDDGHDPATNGTFYGNEDVTDIRLVTEGVYGVNRTSLENVRGIAAAENVLIGFRSRSPIVAALHELGEIFFKPQDIKAKTVNAIDATYLGYRQSAVGKVELTAPPIDYRLTGTALENALDTHMATLRSRHPEIANDALWEAEVRKRLKMRTQEFPKQIQEFARYRHEGIRLEFGYDQQGIAGRYTNEVAEIRDARVGIVQEPDSYGDLRTHFTLEMRGPGANSTDWRPIGGDIDMVLIQNPDGSPLIDVAKRLRVYDQLQELLGMQHGDTITYINHEVRAKLLRQHVYGNPGAEALLIAGPDSRIRTGYLREALSTPEATPANSTFRVVSGSPASLLTARGAGEAHRFATYIQRLDDYLSTLTFYLPGRLAHLVDGLTGDDVLPAFELDGALIQPDGQGGIVVYQLDDGADPIPAPGPRPRTLNSPDHLDTLHAQLVADGLVVNPPSVGAAGGRWVPATIDDGPIALAPMTTLAEATTAGDTRLDLLDATEVGMAANSAWFQPGDRLVIDPGGTNEEIVTVSPQGLPTLAAGLTNDHQAGTAVLRLPPVPGDTTPDTDPDPDRPRFVDVPEGHLFDSEIHWLATTGITRGCNPPDNTNYCPDRPVTRGEMAAFLNRALRLPPGATQRFEDTTTSVFTRDIDAIATAGITRGCNPPDNTNYCPDQPITRGEMAAFLNRALRLPPGATQRFEDATTSVFTRDIDAIATAGITRGCNPPDNTRYCPDRPVTRGEMAAFLHRALR